MISKVAENKDFNIITSCIKNFPNQNSIISSVNQGLLNDLHNSINSQITINNYSSGNSSITLIRSHLIDWLLQVSNFIKITQETFFKTIILFNNYLSHVSKGVNKSATNNTINPSNTNNSVDNYSEVLDTQTLHLIAVICFFISYKFEEKGVMTLEFVRKKLLNNKFTLKEISSKELEIMFTLNFKLTFPTINTFSQVIMEIIKTSLKDKLVDSFIKKFECLYEFVNKISLFVDEFIFDTKAYNISLVNFHTTIITMKNLNLIECDKYENLLLELEKTLAKVSSISIKKVEMYASGLYLAIINQEKSGMHQNLFDTYYSNIDKLVNSKRMFCCI